jgi:hypothetical protein
VDGGKFGSDGCSFLGEGYKDEVKVEDDSADFEYGCEEGGLV